MYYHLINNLKNMLFVKYINKYNFQNIYNELDVIYNIYLISFLLKLLLMYLNHQLIMEAIALLYLHKDPIQ